MKFANSLRYVLLGALAAVLAAPLYWQYTSTLLQAVPVLLVAAGAGWWVLRVRLGPGPHPPGTAWRELGRLVAKGLVGAAALLGLALWLGYRLPWFDTHPGWQQFPQLADSALVAEKISQAQLWDRYHYRLPVIDGDSTPSDFTAVYRTNLRSVRSLGYRVTGNEFHWYWWHTLLRWGRPNDTGQQGYSVYIGPEFRPEGYEYFELRLGSEVAHWKEMLYDPGYTNLGDYYQFNYPTSAQDTLFLSLRGTCWLVHR